MAPLIEYVFSVTTGIGGTQAFTIRARNHDDARAQIQRMYPSAIINWILPKGE